MITRHAIFDWEKSRLLFLRGTISAFLSAFPLFGFLGYHELTGTAPVAGAGGAYRVQLHVVATEDLTTDWADGHGWVHQEKS